MFLDELGWFYFCEFIVVACIYHRANNTTQFRDGKSTRYTISFKRLWFLKVYLTIDNFLINFAELFSLTDRWRCALIKSNLLYFPTFSNLCQLTVLLPFDPIEYLSVHLLHIKLIPRAYLQQIVNLHIILQKLNLQTSHILIISLLLLNVLKVNFFSKRGRR